jgi:hypothetical protein
MRGDHLTIATPVTRRDSRQSVTASEGTEVVVEAVVLHHEEHDVMDPRDEIGSRRALRIRQPAAVELGIPMPQPPLGRDAL